MKRSAAIILILIMLMVYSPLSFAEGSVQYGGSLESIAHYQDEGGVERVAINLSSDKDYSIITLSNPLRLVINIQNAQFPYRIQSAAINSKYIRNIRHAQFDENTVRVVVDLNGTPAYKTQKGTNQIILVLGPTESSLDQVSAPPTLPEASAPAAAVPEDRGSGLANRGSTDRARVVASGKLNIDHAGSVAGDEVVISLGSAKKYNVMKLTDPERIVVDLPNVTAPVDQKQISINGSQVKAIRYASFEKNAARVVLDVNAQSEYNIKETSGKLALNIESARYKNVKYHNNGDRVYLSLEGAKLTEGGEILENLYTGSFDSTGKKYTVTFPSSLADLGTGTLNINDSFINSIDITQNVNAGTTSIIFNAKNKYVYRTITRPDINDTAINILKPASSSEKLVVIDPGHGGIDPGAAYGGLKEKELNLDIATRLNNLLKSKKVKTYMTREDDRFVGLYERTYIANDLNAKLFVSIHNNAMGDTKFGGTMTLYYPSSGGNTFNGKAFAQLIQSKLLSSLKTTDRKIIERPNLVVLKATAMPSALAEIAFMTNSGDRSKLQTADFRQKAAAALCDAIVQALAKTK